MNKLSELSLLYVEDDKELQKQFVRLFKTIFKHVYEAVDGLDALNSYKKNSPNIMLVDINLPKINGLEVIEKIRETNKDIPIIVLSAYSDQTKLLKAIKLGLYEYLIKPVPYEKLFLVFDKIVLEHKSIIEKNNIVALQNNYFWEKDEKCLLYHDTIILLTKRERILFEFMIQQLNQVVPSNSIIYLIWGEEYDISHRSLSHLLKRLRKKLPEELIENIYGEGYKIASNKL